MNWNIEEDVRSKSTKEAIEIRYLLNHRNKLNDYSIVNWSTRPAKEDTRGKRIFVINFFLHLASYGPLY